MTALSFFCGFCAVLTAIGVVSVNKSVRKLTKIIKDESIQHSKTSDNILKRLLDDSEMRNREYNEQIGWMANPDNDWHIREWSDSTLVARQHPETKAFVIAKIFTDKDRGYARRCAEELVDKLNAL